MQRVWAFNVIISRSLTHQASLLLVFLPRCWRCVASGDVRLQITRKLAESGDIVKQQPQPTQTEHGPVSGRRRPLGQLADDAYRQTHSTDTCRLRSDRHAIGNRYRYSEASTDNKGSSVMHAIATSRRPSLFPVPAESMSGLRDRIQASSVE